MEKGPYTKTDRLADVLALIQVLALDRAAHRSEQGITDELQGAPRSAAKWYTLAGEHPEFFRVNPKSDHGLSLAARHVLPHAKDQPTPTLESDFTSALLQTAITLHDRQISRAQYLRPLLPSIVAGLLAILSGVGVALLTAYITHPVAANRFVSVSGISAGVLLDTTKGQYCWSGLSTKPTGSSSLPNCSTER